VRRVAVSLIIILGFVACAEDAGPDPDTLPTDLQIDYHWNNGVSRVSPDYLYYHISLPATGSATISYTLGHPSSSEQEEWAETFEVSDDDLRGLYALMQQVGLFTRTWQPADPVPGASGGPSVRVVAEGKTYNVPSELADMSDAVAIANVYGKIEQMVPETVRDTMEARQAQYLEEHDS